MTTTTSAPASVRQGVVEHLDPTSLVIEANVRPSAPVTKEFVATIRDNGVLTPVLARRDMDGSVLVRAGQRRTLAAREAGLSTIPVYIVDADEQTAERIIQQMIENDQREALTDTDRAAAYQQLAFEGLSVAAIAKRTGTKQDVVRNGIAVAENPVAATAISEHQLTLDQAAALIEFDDETTRTELIEIATVEPAGFAHAVQRARDNITRAELKTAAETNLAGRGFAILDRDYFWDGEFTRITDLITSTGEPVTPDHLTDIDGCAVFVRAYADGTVETSYLVENPKAAGFRKASNAGTGSGPMTDEQKEERRILIANNKAWVSAEAVRRGWLTEFLTRKTLPKDTATAIASGLTTHRHVVGAAIERGNTLAHTLLGVEQSGYWEGDKLAALFEHAPGKAQHVALAVVLAGIEDSTSKNTWRHPDTSKAAYFTQLTAWGYGLSDVERLVTDTNPAEGGEDDESIPSDDDGDLIEE